MARKKPVYKTGKRNPNAYRDKRKDRYIIKIFAVILAVVICGIISILEKLGVTSWLELGSKAGIVDVVTPTDSDFTAYFFDIGQGDSSLIVCDGQSLLIDTGPGNKTESILGALKILKIDSIDYMVISHQHDDHIGGASEIIDKVDIKNLIMPKLSEENMPSSDLYEAFLTKVLEKNINTVAAEPGLSFKIGKAKADVLAPLCQDKNLNNMSVVLKVAFGETSFIFQGDAESKVENALRNEGYDLSADVIKVGHHGSTTSSTKKYIEAVNPKIAIIPCGKNNYGHPKPETIKTLEDQGVDIFITDLLGDITVESDGKAIKVSAENLDEVKVYE